MTDPITTDETVDTTETPDVNEAEAVVAVTATTGADETTETFPREYVEKLRKESAEARVKAKRAEDLEVRLHRALVAATGRLADPEDLPFSEANLDDPEALEAAVNDLLDRKPHLARRVPRGDVGQGVSVPAGTVDLAGLLRARA